MGETGNDNELSIKELEAQINRAPDKNDPQIILLTRKFLMRKTESKLSSETKELLRQRIVRFEPKQIESISSGGTMPQRFKFVREEDEIILFPDSAMDKHMHIDYAVAADMKNPNDAGVFTVDPIGKIIKLEGSSSSSLHIPPWNNPERSKTVERLKGNLPNGYRVETSN